MGYFSNGTEGMGYQEKYCWHCAHDGGCAVWDAHLLCNCSEVVSNECVLGLLIPTKDMENQACKMFMPRQEER